MKANHRAPKPNWQVAGAARPEWTFFSPSEDDAVAAAKTFTRWDLERLGRAGDFAVVLTNLKTYEARNVAIVMDTDGRTRATPR